MPGVTRTAACRGMDTSVSPLEMLWRARMPLRPAEHPPNTQLQVGTATPVRRVHICSIALCFGSMLTAAQVAACPWHTAMLLLSAPPGRQQAALRTAEGLQMAAAHDMGWNI